MDATREELKQAMKEAIVEALEERRDLLASVIEQVLEDEGMLRAMREGERGDLISEDDVTRTLRGES